MARIIPQPQPRLGTFTASSFKPWVGTAGRWAFGAGAAVTLFMSVTPIFQKDILLKVPVRYLIVIADGYLVTQHLWFNTKCPVVAAISLNRRITFYVAWAVAPTQPTYWFVSLRLALSDTIVRFRLATLLPKLLRKPITLTSPAWMVKFPDFRSPARSRPRVGGRLLMELMHVYIYITRHSATFQIKNEGYNNMMISGRRLVIPIRSSPGSNTNSLVQIQNQLAIYNRAHGFKFVFIPSVSFLTWATELLFDTLFTCPSH
ncbi:QCR10 domain-containing protein [Rhizoctonia solani AG-1 IA]|uniref:QCR10 domain-containing protein n=1 Tax=Thanatephorus cucumeris (strain AG1-IA) TaxID=983506 RepID=L8WTK8_THACA|nr:QCR10 domain-containing protein [Rhizoctonia solani AG-1 IA]